MILISFGSSFGALNCQLVRSKQFENNIRILATMWRVPVSRCSCRNFGVDFQNKGGQLWEELRADKGKLRTLIILSRNMRLAANVKQIRQAGSF
jgi:hypothetical protein